MSKIVTDDKVIGRVQKLVTAQASRRLRQRKMKWLSRGIHPESVKDTVESGITSRMPGLRTDMGKPLSTNDPGTYLDLAIHLLSGNPINWQMPRTPQTPQDEQERNGMLERIVKAYIRQNDRRLIKKGMPRLERAVADSLTRYGMVVIHKRIVRIGSGNPEFFMEPWDPMSISERTDDFGLTELTRHYVTTPEELLMIADNEPNAGWNVDQLNQMDKDDRIDDIKVSDYYYRYFDSEDNPVVEKAVIYKTSDKEVNLKSLTVEEDEIEIPAELRLANGETFPGEQTWLAARSVLDVNYEIYLQQDSDIKRIEQHRDRALSQKFKEVTHNGEPNARADEMANPATVDIVRYRSGEEGLSNIPQNPFDPTVSLLPDMRGQMLQRGAVPYILYGGVEINLSGFAIFQLQRAALASVGETKVMGDDLYSDLGKWILDGVRDGGFKDEKITSVVYAQGRETPQLDTFNSSDIPEYTSIIASIELSQPSDLIERINMMRAANPSGGDVFTPETAYDLLFAKEIPDAAGEAIALENNRIMQMPIFQMLKARRKMLLDIRRHELRNETFEADALKQNVALLEANISGQGGNPQTNTPEGSGNTDTRVLSAPTQQQGT